jgi:hypothetical protein
VCDQVRRLLVRQPVTEGRHLDPFALEDAYGQLDIIVPFLPIPAGEVG